MLINKKLFVLTLFLILLSVDVFSLGLMSESGKRFSFKPDLEKTYKFLVHSTTRDVKIEIGAGVLADYVSLSRDYISANDPDKEFYVTIKFGKESPAPGHHDISVKAIEIVDEQQGVGTAVRIGTSILVDVLYPGKFAEVRFGEASAINNTIYFSISAANYGAETIDSFKAKIDIYDENANYIESVYTNDASIESNKRATIYATLNTNGYKVGDYKAKATAYWDNEQTEVEKVFRVGELRLNIIDFTKEIYAGRINKFEVNVNNGWNDIIKDTYVIVKINNEELRSPVQDVAAFGATNFELFWDTTSILPGEYNVEIRAFYSDKSTMEVGKVKVIEEKIQLQPSESKFPTFTIILVAVVLLIIILDILWMRKKKGDQT